MGEIAAGGLDSGLGFVFSFGIGFSFSLSLSFVFILASSPYGLERKFGPTLDAHGNVAYHCGMAMTWEYQEGSVVDYVTFDGGVRRVVVTSREEETGNRYQPGFLGILYGSDDDQLSVWGYDTQIIRVLPRKGQ